RYVDRRQDDLVIGGREQVDDALEVLTPLVEALDPKVHEWLGLLAPGVHRHTRLVAHRGPRARLPVERARRASPSLFAVPTPRRRDRGPNDRALTFVPQAREPLLAASAGGGARSPVERAER